MSTKLQTARIIASEAIQAEYRDHTEFLRDDGGRCEELAQSWFDAMTEDRIYGHDDHIARSCRKSGVPSVEEITQAIVSEVGVADDA